MLLAHDEREDGGGYVLGVMGEYSHLLRLLPLVPSPLDSNAQAMTIMFILFFGTNNGPVAVKVAMTSPYHHLVVPPSQQ